MELAGMEVGGTCNSSVRQHSGKYCLVAWEHMREAVSTPGKQEGRVEHLQLA
jgi:hypothetical protein